MQGDIRGGDIELGLGGEVGYCWGEEGSFQSPLGEVRDY